MRSVLSWFTVRGASFLAAGAVGVMAGLALGSEAMISVGVLLLCLPAFSVLTARRTRYQLRCRRQINPQRVGPGQSAKVSLLIENVSRISTGLLLAEETIPYSLGARPRYVMNGIERGGSREVSYQLRSDLRGKFIIGPLRIRIADVFGLVELSADFQAQSTLTVTPRVVPLLTAPTTGSWSSEGDGKARMTASAGDDDVIPRAYRAGDELRRVHWRSTARYGELMVRREEQRWQDRAVIILDTRRRAHAGTGPSSSFELAVSAAASIGVHLAQSGLDGQLVTDAGPVAASAMFEDVLLDALAVMQTSNNRDFARTTAALTTIESGLIVLIAGNLSAQAAKELAATRREGRQGIALLLATSTWAGQAGQGSRTGQAGQAGQAVQAGKGDRPAQADQSGQGDRVPQTEQPGPVDRARQAGQAVQARALDGAEGLRPDAARPGFNVGQSETAAAEVVLRSAGWRVVIVDAATPLSVAWQRLPRTGSLALPNSQRDREVVS